MLKTRAVHFLILFLIPMRVVNIVLGTIATVVLLLFLLDTVQRDIERGAPAECRTYSQIMADYYNDTFTGCVPYGPPIPGSVKVYGSNGVHPGQAHDRNYQ